MSILKAALITAVVLTLQTAHAAIIYSGADRNINVNQFHPEASISVAGSNLKWDDLVIRLTVAEHPSGQFTSQATTHPGNGSHVRTAGEGKAVSNLKEGSVINASINYTIKPQNFFKHTYSYKFSEAHCAGNFQSETGYIGLQLCDAGKTYFGWAQISTENSNNENASLTVHDWAYNTIAGQAIKAGQDSIPEPNSMSLFTACAGGVLFIRRIFLI